MPGAKTARMMDRFPEVIKTLGPRGQTPVGPIPVQLRDLERTSGRLGTIVGMSVKLNEG